LAAIGAVAGFIGRTMIGVTIPFLGTYRTPLTTGLVFAVFTVCMAVVSMFIISFVINALAPTFNGEQNFSQAMKIAVYSYTPTWLAGVLGILPALGLLAILGALYGLYLLYLGLPRLMKCPEDKALGYTIVVVICAIVLSVIVSLTGAAIVGTAALTSGAMTGALGGNGGIFGNAPAGRTSGSGSQVKYDPNSPLGKLQQLGEKLDESNKKMEAAQKAGDAQGTAAAAMQGLGALLGGGNHVESVPIDQLKPFVPETLGGMTRKSNNVEKSGIAGLMVTKATASFSNEGGKNINLEITDTGGISGITALAGWTGMQEEKDNENESERTHKVDGRLVHEKVSKRGGTNEYGIVLGDRFVVGATGNVSLDELKAAVAGLNLAKLESMKDAGKDAAASK
ncbi:MAG TPA: Yip1 family protein, partial [Vicinamibacterales bacterium]|nr:Yip1 family protein [Vicinamibacterales bacterium]